MTQHIYLSMEQTLMPDRAPRPDDKFTYRGEIDLTSDSVSFKNLMAKRGLEVLLSPKGEASPVTGPTGLKNIKHWHNIPRRNIEGAV